MMLQETYTLSNGVKIPKLGLGTWMIGNDAVSRAVVAAVGIGYRHIDTAQAYQNEAGVGEGIRASGAVVPLTPSTSEHDRRLAVGAHPLLPEEHGPARHLPRHELVEDADDDDEVDEQARTLRAPRDEKPKGYRDERRRRP